jgi:hypothetical protein
MRLLALFVLTVAFGAAVFAAAAKASKPIFIGPAPTPDFVAETSCPFPVLVHTAVNKEVSKMFGDGKVIVTGSLKQTVTNLVNGKSETYNVSGPLTITPNADGTTTFRFEGRTGLLLPAGALGPGAPACSSSPQAR